MTCGTRRVKASLPGGPGAYLLCSSIYVPGIYHPRTDKENTHWRLLRACMCERGYSAAATAAVAAAATTALAVAAVLVCGTNTKTVAVTTAAATAGAVLVCK